MCITKPIGLWPLQRITPWDMIGSYIINNKEVEARIIINKEVEVSIINNKEVEASIINN